jgi:hypothetical protein
MNCTNCGKSVPDNAKVCGYCGHRLKTESVPAPAIQPPVPVEHNIKTHKKGIGLLIGAGIVIVGLAVAIIFMLTRDKPLVLIEQPNISSNLGSIQEIAIDPVVETNPDTSANTSNDNCIDRALLTGETIPDGTQISPGATFTKTWKFRNNGTCTWTPQYSLSMNSGHAFETQGNPNLQGSVVP